MFSCTLKSKILIFQNVGVFVNIETGCSCRFFENDFVGFVCCKHGSSHLCYDLLRLIPQPGSGCLSQKWDSILVKKPARVLPKPPWKEGWKLQQKNKWSRAATGAKLWNNTSGTQMLLTTKEKKKRKVEQQAFNIKRKGQSGTQRLWTANEKGKVEHKSFQQRKKNAKVEHTSLLTKERRKWNTKAFNNQGKKTKVEQQRKAKIEHKRLEQQRKPKVERKSF